MGYVGKVFPSLTKIEIDETGNIWMVVNNVNSTVIEELNAVSHGRVLEEESVYREDYYDPFDDLWIR